MTEEKVIMDVLSVEDAVAILKPLVVKWKRNDKETADRFNAVYKKVKLGDWGKILEQSGLKYYHWSRWCEEFKFPLRMPQCSHKGTGARLHLQAVHTIVPDGKGGTKTVTQEFEYDGCTRLFDKTSDVISNGLSLMVSDFKVSGKDKKVLIDRLSELRKHIDFLLEELK